MAIRCSLLGSMFVCLAGILLVQAGDTYVVADWDSDRDLFEVTPEGAIRRITQGVPWEQIRSVAVDAQGNYILAVNIYESGQNLDGIYRMSPEGVVTPVVAGDEVPEPLAIAIDANGDYIVINQRWWILEAAQILRITPAGEVTELHAGEPLHFPTDLAIDAQGNYVIVDRGSEGRVHGTWWSYTENGEVYRFNPVSKEFTVVYSALDADKNVIEDRMMSHLAGVAIDKDGNYVVVNSAPHLDSLGRWKTPTGNPSILRISPGGELLAEHYVPTLDNVYPIALGIGIGSDGNYIIADAVGTTDSSGRLLRMTPQGEVSTIILTNWMGQTGDVFVRRGSAAVQQHVRFTNATSLVIHDAAPASLYPSRIEVSGQPGTVATATVTLRGLSHPWPQDVGALLVGPRGQRVLLMANAGGGQAITDVDLTFDDTAATALNDSDGITSRACKPGFSSTGETFFTPAPAPPYGTALGTFSGTDANGVWSLYMQDDQPGDSGALARGWSLALTLNVTPQPAGTPALSTPKALSMEQFQFTLAGASGSNYQIQVSSDLSSWKLLRTVKLANSTTNILDSTTNQTPRFYRAKLVP